MRAPVPSLMSGISPSRFGGSTCKSRTGATAAMTDGVGVASGFCASVFCAPGCTVGNDAEARAASPEGETVLTASYSASEIKPLSRSKAAKWSRCSEGVPATATARASSGVMTPFVKSTRTSGSLIEGSAGCGLAGLGALVLSSFFTSSPLG